MIEVDLDIASCIAAAEHDGEIPEKVVIIFLGVVTS